MPSTSDAPVSRASAPAQANSAACPLCDPVGADEVAKAVAAHGEFRRHDQPGAVRRGLPHGLLDGSPVRLDLPGPGREMKQGNR